jgi:hypothetical protein
MEDVMKTRIVMVAAVMMIAIQFVFAGENEKKYATSEKKIAYATKNLLVALESENLGLIEGAIRITAQMKMQYPSADVTELMKAMDNVRWKNPSGALRYKAFIGMTICSNPDLFGDDVRFAKTNDENFFRNASLIMQEQFLSSNSL